MQRVHKCDSCRHRTTVFNNLVGCAKKRKIIVKGDYDDCDDYQPQLVDFDAFKDIFGKVGVAY